MGVFQALIKLDFDIRENEGFILSKLLLFGSLLVLTAESNHS